MTLPCNLHSVIKAKVNNVYYTFIIFLYIYIYIYTHFKVIFL